MSRDQLPIEVRIRMYYVLFPIICEPLRIPTRFIKIAKGLLKSSIEFKFDTKHSLPAKGPGSLMLVELVPVPDRSKHNETRGGSPDREGAEQLEGVLMVLIHDAGRGDGDVNLRKPYLERKLDGTGKEVV